MDEEISCPIEFGGPKHNGWPKEPLTGPLRDAENPVAKYRKSWKWQGFGKSVRSLLFRIDAGEFNCFVNDVLVEETKPNFEMFCSLRTADAMSHVDACVVIFPDSHWYAWFADADFFAEEFDVDGLLDAICYSVNF